MTTLPLVPQATLQFEVRDSLDAILAADWDALDDSGNPFVRHAFLHALEDTGCLGDSTGWYPRYVLLWRGIALDDAGVDGDATLPEDVRELIGAIPAYVKMNSYGEFVFDWAWADAFQRHGHAYYPKLVAAIPFTPATGPRLLVRADQPWQETVLLLSGALRQFAAQEDYSSVHYLFLTERESDLLSGTSDAAAQGSDTGDDAARAPEVSGASEGPHLARLDCQYHWHNAGYADYDEFLSLCTSRRRKTLKRERRYVSDAGLRLERRRGDTLSLDEWSLVHRFYSSTFDRKWGNPSLTEAFFQRIGTDFGAHTLIVFAYDPNDAKPEEPVACSVMFQGKDTLYGRYWGCRRDYNALHFEACYYQGIEHCIEHGLKHFEPGAQGEHKITRGFEPRLTRSAHWIFHDGFRDAIAQFLAEERPHMRQRCSGLTDLLPFKSVVSLP